MFRILYDRRFGTAALLSSLITGSAPKAAPRPFVTRDTNAVAAATDSGTPRILVGPNVQVSLDGDVPHVELHVAANPKNLKNLLSGGVVASRTSDAFAFANKAYASRDGGFTWFESQLPGHWEDGGADPQVAFTRSGTAIFTALTHRYDSVTKRDRAMLHAWRSTNGGFAWDPPAELGFGYDHEQIAVDLGRGAFGGRVYLGVLYGYPVYRVGVFRSDDDGRSWIGPAEAGNGKGEYGINVANLVIFSDGTLLVPFSDFEFKPDRRKENPHSNMWFATSKDGGVTFSEPKKVFQQFRGANDVHHLTTFPVWAVDAQGAKFRDRLYVAWTDFRSGRARILFAFSSDRGQTWTEPRLLDPEVPSDADQFQAEAVVNKDGVLGISWFDTRGSQGEFKYHQYFTASLDGGATFLPAKRVSNQFSKSGGAGNLRWLVREQRAQGKIQVGTISAASRWFHGGDYMGLTVDPAGVFHPVWADARTGTFQMYTAQVRVETGPETTPANLTRADVTDRVRLVFDPANYDSATKTFTVMVKLRNAGDQPIYGPLTVELSGTKGDTTQGGSLQTIILNAANGNRGDGAIFDYGKALGDLTALERGAQSEGVVWQLRVPDPLEGPNLTVKVFGMIAGE